MNVQHQARIYTYRNTYSASRSSLLRTQCHAGILLHTRCCTHVGLQQVSPLTPSYILQEKKFKVFYSEVARQKKVKKSSWHCTLFRV